MFMHEHSYGRRTSDRHWKILAAGSPQRTKISDAGAKFSSMVHYCFFVFGKILKYHQKAEYIIFQMALEWTKSG
jgi:hypothetical protein